MIRRRWARKRSYAFVLPPQFSCQEFTWIEYFAGRGNVTKCMKAALHRSARLDLKDYKRHSVHNSNYMDMSHPSGYAPPARLISRYLMPGPLLRLALLMMLSCVPQGFAVHFGIKCSSFCKVNVGTSFRTAATPMGLMEYPSVKLANCLLERRRVSRVVHVCDL